jgi:hypothetical protein
VNATAPVLRTLAFGDVERTVWGAAWILGDGGSALTTVGAGGERTAALSLRASVDQEAGEWRLHGDQAALVVTPAGDGVAVADSDDHVDGFDQLCRVSGRFELDGVEHAVECLGLRTSRSGGIELDEVSSIRAVSSWYEPDEGLALIAFRGRKAKAHDGDVVTATVLGPERSTPVEDPRLSTTYGSGGWPLRASLELWLGGEEEQEQYPRRASGEAIGVRAQTVAGGLDVRAEPFRWHSRGREGAGIYMLASRQ